MGPPQQLAGRLPVKCHEANAKTAPPQKMLCLPGEATDQTAICLANESVDLRLAPSANQRPSFAVLSPQYPIAFEHITPIPKKTGVRRRSQTIEVRPKDSAVKALSIFPYSGIKVTDR